MSRSRRRIAILIVSLFVLGGQTGCWDRREVNDIAIVTGTAFDKVGEEYRAAVQFPLAGQMGGPGGGGGGTSGEKTYYVDSGKGKTIREANSDLQRSLSRQLYFAHRRILVIGEDLAREDIKPVMDIVSRTALNRLNTYVVFSKGEAINVLSTEAVLEQVPAEMIRELAVHSMKSPPTIRSIINVLLTEGIDLAVPYLVSEKTQTGSGGKPKPTLKMEGLALFKESKLVGYVKDEEAQGLIWAMNQARRPNLTLEIPEAEGYLTVTFSENQVEVTPVIQGEQVEMRIKIRALGHLFENGSNFKTASDNMRTLQQVASKRLISDVEKGIEKAQQLGSDVCGFGDAIYSSKPNDWRRIGSKWREIYPQVKVTVIAELQFEHSGTLQEPPARTREELISK